MSLSGHKVENIEVYVVDLRQDVPYLGPLRSNEKINPSGYFVRKGNRTVYPAANRSLVVRVTTDSGVEGWGETYGLVAPRATTEIILDLLSGFVCGRDPYEAESIHDDLYDLMRVRGYTGGFYLDALAAIDIALWDIKGRIAEVPVYSLIGGQRHSQISGYISGLPEKTIKKRCDLAVQWLERDFHSFKFAVPVANEGAANELHELRKALGSKVRIACDLHWSLSKQEAVSLAREMAPDRPWFLEAPVAPEDISGLQWVAEHSGETIAAGEEWRTVFDAKYRIDSNACHIIQPEMGHTGITQFMRICHYAEAHNLEIIPHATIGSGIFLAASLQASAALSKVTAHEYQHSVFEPFRHFTGDAISCEKGFYSIPAQPGLGVEPSTDMWKAMQKVER